MIEVPTTLLLGAGASVAYGLPLGNGLTEMLVGQLGHDKEMHKVLLNAGFKAEQIEEFRMTFHYSQRGGIDDFLARRQDFTEVGKAAIAAAIKMSERAELLMLPKYRDDHWYKYLWNEIGTSWEGLGDNRLSIVTFNYDRSLEEYLIRTMAATFRKSREECIEKLRVFLPFVHVYGSVGGSYGPPDGGNNMVSYLDPNELSAASAEIKVIPEGRDSDTSLVEARRLLAMAERIAIMGFGFDHLNLQRLNANRSIGRQGGPNSDAPAPWVVATAAGLTPRQAQQAAQRCGLTNLPTGFGQYPTNFIPKRCLEVLTESLILSWQGTSS